ncbi:phospholipid carrier-dependent glycosyltransferase [Patescibacteria group bacterium]|nr:phospholipid carrier-dependent glycosyltransferase [Patescibacteria group bacterium]
MRKMTQTDWLIVGGLTLLAGILRFVNLPHPKEIIFDETYFANFAHNYLTHTKFFDAEPPLGKFIIAGGEWLFGYNSDGWRSMPALFGTLTVPLFYLFTKKLFGGRLIPLFAGLLALLDGLLFVESRTAVLDGFVVFFNLLTYLLFFMSLQASSRKRSVWWLAATGVSLGLALSLKWITLAFLGPAVGLLLVLAFAKRRRIQKFFKVRSAGALFDAVGATVKNLQHPLTYVALLGVLPLAVYYPIFAAHLPFDSTGQGWLQLHQTIYNYHHTLKATHPYGSAWYTWPFLIRPVAYYFKTVNGQWEGIVALGNPIIWWSGVAAMLYVVWKFVKLRSLALAFIILAFLAHYGPWTAIGRILFVYHYLGGLPFVFIALAVALRDYWHWRPKDTSAQVLVWLLLFAGAVTVGALLGRSALGMLPGLVGYGLGGLLIGAPVAWLVFNDWPKGWRWGRKQVVVFFGICVLAFIYFYPIWTGIGLNTADYLRHMWLRSWI